MRYSLDSFSYTAGNVTLGQTQIYVQWVGNLPTGKQHYAIIEAVTASGGGLVGTVAAGYFTAQNPIFEGNPYAECAFIAAAPLAAESYKLRIKAADSPEEAATASAYTGSFIITVVTPNSPPTTPPGIYIPSTINGGSAVTITWAGASDANGNLAGYILEKSTNGGAWTQIYQGISTSFTDSVAFGTVSAAYRVKAYDSQNAVSGYATSPVITVDNTLPPVIESVVSGDLGLISADFSWRYTVSQESGETTSLTESIDGAAVRSFTAELGKENTFDVSGMAFMTLLNGKHTMTVTAVTGGKSAEYSVTFTKGVYSMSVTLETPLLSDELITMMVADVVGAIPPDAEYQILVMNNALDSPPVWENATAAIKAGRNHVFTNGAAENGGAFNFIITAARGASGAGGYISSIGGAFE